MDRQKLLQQVQDSAKGDLATSGLQIDAFTIQSINDESGYIDLLGAQKMAIVERDARIAKASSDQEAAVREAEANQVKINAERDVELRRAEVLTLTAAAQARAAQAGPLAQAESQQEVTRRQTELADLEAARTEKELLTSTIRPAEAEAEAVVRRAEGDKTAKIAAAQAEAERQKLAGQAEAAVIQVKGEAGARVVEVNAHAEAQRVTLEGNAEAQITLSKGEAEAKALALRAEAFQKFNEAAVIQTVLGMLPEIVRAAAEPMSRIDNLTVLSNDGASELVRNTTRTVTEASATVKGLTGLDVPALISNAMGGATTNGSPKKGSGSSGGGGGGDRPARRQPANEPASTTPPPTPRPRVDAAPSTPPEPAVIETSEQADAALDRASQAIRRASDSVAAAAGTMPPMPPMPSGSPGDESTTAMSPIGPDTPVTEAAAMLAQTLRLVPGVENHLAVPLADLDRRGPRAMRAAWRMARERLESEYGAMTVGELMARFADRGSARQN